MGLWLQLGFLGVVGFLVVILITGFANFSLILGLVLWVLIWIDWFCNC